MEGIIFNKGDNKMTKTEKWRYCSYPNCKAKLLTNKKGRVYCSYHKGHVKKEK